MERKENILFSEIPLVIKSRFLSKLIIITVLIIANTIILFSSGYTFEFGVLYFPILLYALIQVFSFIKVLRGEYKKFVGECICITKPEYNLRMFGDVYGYSTMVLKLSDDAQVIIPISNNFNIEEGDSASFFAKKSDFYQKSEKIWEVGNPLALTIEARN